MKFFQKKRWTIHGRKCGNCQHFKRISDDSAKPFYLIGYCEKITAPSSVLSADAINVEPVKKVICGVNFGCIRHAY